MNERNERLARLGLTLALIALNLIALNYLFAGWSAARLDLTEEGLYSITPATERLLSSLDEEVTIYGYFSQRTHPKLAPLVPELEDLLDEYHAVSRGKVHVEIIDPAEDDEVAQEAADRYGVQSTPFQLASKYETGIVNAYFALVVRYGDQYERYGFGDLIEVEGMPNGDLDVRLRNPEYDLTRAIKKVVYGFRTTNELFGRIEDPVRLIAIMSPETLPEMFAEVPAAVRTAAEELKERGGDKFTYEELNPVASEEDRAAVELEWRLPPQSVGLFGDDEFYLYGLLEVGGRFEQLAFTAQELTAATIREAVENSLRRQTPGFLKTVGIVTPQPVQLPPQLQMQMQVPPERPEFEQIKRFLAADYQVRDVDLATEGGVPSEVDVLLVIKPKNLDEQSLFHLDQYLMRGGRVVLCAGNFEADVTQGGLTVVPVTTGIDEWLEFHGVRVEKTMVLDDRNQALPIPQVRNTVLGQMRTWVLEPYPYLVQVTSEGFRDRDITASLDAVGIYWGSPIELIESGEESNTGLETLPILESSELSWSDSDLTKVGYVDYEIPEETSPRLLSVALAGRFPSYYTDHPLPTPATPAAGPHGEATDAAPPPPPLALIESPETRLVVVGNAEFLSDFVATTIGQLDGGFFVENLRFVENLVDWVSLDNDMIGIRSRGLVSRRLHVDAENTRASVEVANYVLPVGALLALGIFVRMRRRQTVPIVSGPPAEERS